MANSIHDLIKDRMNGRDSISLPKHSSEDATVNSWVSKGVDDWNENSRKGYSIVDYAWNTMGDVMAKYDLFKRDPSLALSWISSGKSSSDFLSGLTKGWNNVKQFTRGLDSVSQTISTIQTGTSDKVNTLSSIINRNDMNTFGAAKKTFNEALNTLSTVGGMYNKVKKTKTTDKSSLMYWLELYAANPSDFAQLADTYIPMDKAPTEVKAPQDGFKYDTERAKYQLDKKYIAKLPAHYDETVKEYMNSLIMSNSSSSSATDSDINAGILNNTLKFNPYDELSRASSATQKELRRIKADYFEQSNPDIYHDITSYDSSIDSDHADYAGTPNTKTTQSNHKIKDGDDVSFQDIIESLRADGYLSGYKDIAGFELGTNHQWKIEIYPYPYELDDVKRYETLKRNSCVPPLPCYILPNLWGKKKNKNAIQRRPSRDDVVNQSVELARNTSNISGAQELLKQASSIVNQAATGVADILSSVGVNSKALTGIVAATSNEESNVHTNMLKFQQSGTGVALTDVGEEEVNPEYNTAKERDIPRDYRDKISKVSSEKSSNSTMLSGVITSILKAQGTYNEENLQSKTEVESDDESAPVIFSFSKNPPIMSYDLNIGNVNTESIPLFGGSSMTVFGGMTYSVIMNIDMVDDVFGSMDKYMLHYINCVEDKYKNARAPYYNCAFYIKLKIFEAGGHIKQALNLIGVPITYTPRYDGQDQANESRISITFGIIGYKPPVTTDNEDNKRNATYKNKVGDIMWRYGNPSGKAIIMSKDRYTASNQAYNGQADLIGRRYGTLADLTWADIRLNIGNVSPVDWDKNTTFHASTGSTYVGDTLTSDESSDSEEVDTTTDKE